MSHGSLTKSNGFTSPRRLRHVKSLVGRNLAPADCRTSLQFLERGEPEGHFNTTVPRVDEPSCEGSFLVARVPLPEAVSSTKGKGKAVTNADFWDHTDARRANTQRHLHGQFDQVASASVSQLTDAYYTLTAVNGGRQDEPFYTSEVVRGSLNPMWRSLDTASYALWAPLNESSFILKIYTRCLGESCYRLSIERVINLRQLRYLGEELADESCSFLSTTIIIALDDGYYQFDPSMDVDANDEEEVPCIKVPPHKVRPSYRYETILRIVAAQKEIWELRRSVCTIIDAGEGILSQQQDSRNLLHDYKTTKARLAFIEDNIMQRTEDVKKARHHLKETGDLLQSGRQHLREAWDTKDSDERILRGDAAGLAVRRDEIYRIRRKVRRRQKDLIVDAANIFPIARDTALNSAFYTIRGIPLPHSEYTGHDDEKIAAALGFVCHLLYMIAYYLDVPLRYPMKLMSSRSSITDIVSEHYTGSKEFPLYSRGADRMRFDYGVFLMNKNIEQLMGHLQLTVTNLRHTLPNLKAIIDAVSGWNDDRDVDGDESDEAYGYGSVSEFPSPRAGPSTLPAETRPDGHLDEFAHAFARALESQGTSITETSVGAARDAANTIHTLGTATRDIPPDVRDDGHGQGKSADQCGHLQNDDDLSSTMLLMPVEKSDASPTRSRTPSSDISVPSHPNGMNRRSASRSGIGALFGYGKGGTRSPTLERTNPTETI
ncbi:uncharacterized protein SPPG_03843 [Spizellomyces punctatus DAOM BR117]|uniref:Autophagy-related protein 14 n=1 Tax=Spizellomyces punctatus (strain DAOM BR117) TaxID=645134 RepID=A0A0L0HI03_SPIPD|nr:uncharacterized protein SPPG_03843 [Spizellomyces punctatus DAOM BR117]KND00727.1 hypothetical protein SPPG_03843 [Spizellomyces punctatus DAOM BR117]|eukprot:XP_016608766.1 hypothetical protein SPPG_03843 [Spizellomyces punctatus DAOM BR117]